MNEKNQKKLLGIPIFPLTKNKVLEKIKKHFKRPTGFYHIVSLNPENLVIASENLEFKKVIKTAQIKIVDGIGVVLACRILGMRMGERITGVDLMKDLLLMANEMRLRVLFIGGKGNLANKLVNCYSQKYPQAKFFGFEGISNIKNPQKSEEERIFTIVSDFKPHLVLVAFGSPFQELWIARHKKEFSNSVVMGVGGAFDFLGGIVPRAPVFIRKIGLEWFFRLLVQPWRWRRQMRLIKFGWLVIEELLNRFFS